MVCNKVCARSLPAVCPRSAPGKNSQKSRGNFFWKKNFLIFFDFLAFFLLLKTQCCDRRMAALDYGGRWRMMVDDGRRWWMMVEDDGRWPPSCAVVHHLLPFVRCRPRLFAIISHLRGSLAIGPAQYLVSLTLFKPTMTRYDHLFHLVYLFH